MKRRIASLLLVVLLLWEGTCLPGALAAPSSRWDGTVDLTWYAPGEDTYEISTPAQLAGLAALVNGMVDPDCPEILGDASLLACTVEEDVTLVGASGGGVSARVYTSQLDFAHQTVYITADLDMGGHWENGAWSGPNWAPIGGDYAMDSGALTGDSLVLNAHFNGVLDGQGHSISNLRCERFSPRGFAYSQSIGLVGTLGGHTGCGTEAATTLTGDWRPAVRNLVLESGLIYGRRRVGGIVGCVGDTPNGVVIENCANGAGVRNTDAKGIGGIVGYGGDAGVIRNCYNTGDISTTYTCPAGGIIGSNCGMNLYNCYNVGRVNSNGNLRGRGVGGHDSGSYQVENCYYLEGCDDDPVSEGWYKGSASQITIDVCALSGGAMGAPAFLDELNGAGGAFTADTGGINGGYPVLYFQGTGGAAAGTVTLRQPVGGQVEADGAGSLPAGKTVALSARADEGYVLKYYTLDAAPLAANFFTVSGDAVISAVFAPVKEVAVSLPAPSEAYDFALTRTGHRPEGGALTFVTDEPVSGGSVLLEGNVLTIHAVGWSDAVPEDLDHAFTDAFTFAVTNADKNADGTYTVNGDGPVAVSVTRSQARKSWPSIGETSWYTGNRQTYTLYTAEELAGLARLVNEQGVDFAGVSILLGQDISLGNTDGTVGLRTWEGIGRSPLKAFRGVFDGCGHVISDLNAHSAGSYTGLFGYCVGAEIKNVTVLGQVEGDAEASYAGGIVAYASKSKLSSCINYATIRAAGTGAAGIAAYICDGSTLTDCINYGAVQGASGVGGIVGVSYSVDDSIVGCTNAGTLSAAGEQNYGTGGIAARLAGTIRRCGNVGNIISADRYTGGLAGYTTARTASNVMDAYNSGAITASSGHVNASVGGLVGYGQYLTLSNCQNTGAVTASGSFQSGYLGETMGRMGAVVEGPLTDVGLFPAFSPAAPPTQAQNPGPYRATFVADGVVVDVKSYAAGATDVSPPPIPPKEGHTGVWAPYALGLQDITVHAIYRQHLLYGGETITQSGTYFTSHYASGTIAVGGGLQVTLDGSNGPCKNLAIAVGEGTELTLRDLSISAETTALTARGGTLRWEGENSLTAASEEKSGAHPGVLLLGDTTWSGGGSLRVTAGGNQGAISAPNATIEITGGTLFGGAEGNNIPALSAKHVVMSGGRVYLQADRSPLAIEAEGFAFTGGGLYALGWAAGQTRAGREAVSGLTGTVGGTFLTPMPFTDVSPGEGDFAGIYHCVQAGYLQGTSERTFSPGLPMNRAMFVTVLYRMAGSPAVDGPSPFQDTPDTWYQSAVLWAVQNDITSGVSAAAFAPNQQVSAEQLAVFLLRFGREQGYDGMEESGNHPGASPWAQEGVSWAVAHGLLGAEEEMSAPASRALLASAVHGFDQFTQDISAEKGVGAV